MTTTRRFFSGDSLEQAVMQAARHHHLLPDKVAYKLIEKRHGFLKIRRGVVISVDPASPAKGEEAEVSPPAVEPSPPSPRDEPQAITEPEPELESAPARSPKRRSRKSSKKSEGRSSAKGDGETRQVAPWHLADEDEETSVPEQEVEPVVEAALVVTEEPEPAGDLAEESPVDDEGGPTGEDSGDDIEESLEEPSDDDEEKFELVDDMADGAKEAVEQLLEFADIEGMSIEVGEGEDRLEVKLSGEAQDRLLEDRGALLLAVEHLVPRLLRGILGRSAPCRVDCGGFHEDREQRLGDLATDAADEARRRQRPRTLAPMSPEERRIVHMTLADDPDVRTESQGRGFFKRVTVSPVRHRSRVFD